MKLLKTPLWNLEGGEPVDVDHHVVRIKLYKDEVVAEFTISELCSFFGLKDLHCLRLQFEVWHELASFEWDSEECVHLEQKPFTDYFHASKISHCYAPPSPDADRGGWEWGMKKAVNIRLSSRSVNQKMVSAKPVMKLSNASTNRGSHPYSPC